MYEQKVKVTIMGSAGNAVSDKKMIDVVKQAAQDVPYFHKDLITEMGQGFGTDDACTFITAIQEQGGFGTYAQIAASFLLVTIISVSTSMKICCNHL